MPWWNPYSGVGLPLAAEYQPAALSPFTLLLLLPNGTVWLQVVLQILAGIGAYGLLRQLGMGRVASTTGGLLFAFNGTLAWFAHGPATAVPYLPWMLWGIERARARAAGDLGGGWRMFALAMAASLLAGFPETAYINGLLALAWAVLRFVQAGKSRVTFAQRVAVGGLVGIALAAPQVVAFFLYLPEAHIGDHAHFARAGQAPQAFVPSLVAPYVHGPIFAHIHAWHALPHVWGGIGGYVTAALVVVAIYGLAARRSALHWLLAGWIVLVLGKTFVIEPAVWLWNLVPGVAISAFARYAQPTWQLALVVLATAGLDALARGERGRTAWAVAALGFIALAAAGFGLVSQWWLEIYGHVRLRNWALGSAFWAMATCVVALAFLRPGGHLATGRRLAALLVIDAMVMYAIPVATNPRSGQVDAASITFLRENLGFQRFYTLGPIQANYGAYYGIASINHNYLPVAHRWVEWVQANLDPAVDPVLFIGNAPRPPEAPSQAEALRERIPAYERAGVKYVVTFPGQDPFAPMRGKVAAPAKVHSGRAMDIYELPKPAPYFETLGARCDMVIESRERLTIGCDGPATLVRRELYFPGWSVKVAGDAAALGEHGGLFQSVAIPAGRSTVRFRYAPPHIGWAWLAALLGALAFIGLRFPRARRRGASATPAAVPAA